MSTPESDEDIFDPEIIYCVSKVVIEPFITCIFDKEKYETGDDYSIVYLESIENKYLCVAFGEELNHIDSLNNVIVKKGNHHTMGTILVVGNKGGTIILNNPLTNISTMYYSYINSLTDSPSFKKVSFIPEKENYQKDKIYISNSDTIVYKQGSIEIERVPVGSWTPTKEIYPKHVFVKGIQKPSLRINIDDEFMTSSLPSINEDNEIVESPHQLAPRMISIPPSHKSEDDESVSCCIKYFLIPIYEWFVSKLKSLKHKQPMDRTFIDIELP